MQSQVIEEEHEAETRCEQIGYFNNGLVAYWKNLYYHGYNYSIRKKKKKFQISLYWTGIAKLLLI